MKKKFNYRIVENPKNNITEVLDSSGNVLGVMRQIERDGTKTYCTYIDKGNKHEDEVVLDLNLVTVDKDEAIKSLIDVFI